MPGIYHGFRGSITSVENCSSFCVYVNDRLEGSSYMLVLPHAGGKT